MKHLKDSAKNDLNGLKVVHMIIVALLLSVIIIKNTTTTLNDLTSKNSIEQTLEEDPLDESDSVSFDFICPTKHEQQSSICTFALKTTSQHLDRLMVLTSKGAEDPPPENSLI